MPASLMLFIAALAQSAGASRFYPTVLTPHPYGSALHISHPSPLDGPMTYAPERFPGLQMQEVISPLFGQQLVDNWRALLGGAGQERSFYTFQSLPPDKLYDVDVRKLLQTCLQNALLWKRLQKPFLSDYVLSLAQDRSSVLQRMLEDIRQLQSRLKTKNQRRSETNENNDTLTLAEVSSSSQAKKNILRLRGGFEVVGLVPDDLPSTTSPSPEYVKSIGIISREKLKDNKAGSLLAIVEAQLGSEATRGMLGGTKKLIPVFAIEGLSDLAASSWLGGSSNLARKLLRKIAEWAQTERRLLVVSQRGAKSFDGSDLSAFYKRLGFEKVKMDDGSYVLVYLEDWYPSTRGKDGYAMVGLQLGWPW